MSGVDVSRQRRNAGFQADARRRPLVVVMVEVGADVVPQLAAGGVLKQQVDRGVCVVESVEFHHVGHVLCNDGARSIGRA